MLQQGNSETTSRRKCLNMNDYDLYRNATKI